MLKVRFYTIREDGKISLRLTSKLKPKKYTGYFTAQNLGIKQLDLKELSEDTNDQLKYGEFTTLKDIKRYQIYLITEPPIQTGLLITKDLQIN